MTKLVRYIFYLIHWIYDMKIHNSLDLLAKRLYSLWVRNEFKYIGDKCLFSKFSLLKGGEYIEIGDHSTFGKSVVLTAWSSYNYKDIKSGEFLLQEFCPSIKIGNHCIIGDNAHITAVNSIIIEDGVLTGRWVTISDNSHGKFDEAETQIPPANRQIISKGGVHICKNVWIGDKATILPGVTIGEGAIIGSNAVVTKDVPPYSIVAGCPAHVLKSLESK